MKNFFYPKSIAVVGASNKEGKVGYVLMKKLLKFDGDIFPVNIKESYIAGLRCYDRVTKIKEKIDLAIIATPAVTVPEIVKDCSKKKIDSLVIISSGFSEVGNDKLEQDILKTVARSKMKIIGPNCFGIVNSSNNLDSTFALSSPQKGGISFISQSGALWSAVSDWSVDKFGFSKFVSLGNMSDVDFNDALEYLCDDEDTEVIVLYIEYLTDGKNFLDIVNKCEKLIIAVKAGQSEAGKEAALSHTGSLAGEFEIYKAAFSQAGVILADSLSNAFDMASFLTLQGSPKGNQVLIVTNAGGPGALVADFCEKAGLKVVSLPKNLISELDKVLPSAWSRHNPLDVLGDADSSRFYDVFEALNKEDFFDILLCIVTPQTMTDIEKIALALKSFKEKSTKKIVACFMGSDSMQSAELIFKDNKIPNFFELKQATDMLGKIV